MNKPAPWWLAILLSFAFSVVSGVIVLGFTRSANGYDKVKADIEKRAPYDYVDKQIKDTRDEIKDVKADQQKTIDRIDDNLKEIRSYILKKE